MQIQKDHVVTLTYTLTNPDGKVLDQTTADNPLVYLHGRGTLIPGLESRIEQQPAGHSLTVNVPAKEAYGERDPHNIIVAGRGEFPPDATLEPGIKFWVESEEGKGLVTIVEVNEDSVTLDNNHPLAGVDLTFAVDILAVRMATAREVKDGQVHGSGDCDCCD